MHAQMWPIATDVARSMVCVLGTGVSCGQMNKLIKMQFRGWLAWAQGITN